MQKKTLTLTLKLKVSSSLWINWNLTHRWNINHSEDARWHQQKWKTKNIFYHFGKIAVHFKTNHTIKYSFSNKFMSTFKPTLKTCLSLRSKISSNMIYEPNLIWKIYVDNLNLISCNEVFSLNLQCKIEKNIPKIFLI